MAHDIKNLITLKKNNMTLNQISALKYANGQNDLCPSYSVAKRLERKGLIVWMGYSAQDYKGRNANNNTPAKGWGITEEGKKILYSIMNKIK